MRIAIIKLSALGDIVLAMVVLQAIKKQYPDAVITWVCDERHLDILKHNPDIDHIHSIRLKELKKTRSFSLLYREWKSLKKNRNYDIVIDLQGLLKSAIVSRFLGKNIHGFDRKSAREALAAFLYHQKYSIPYAMNTIDRNCRLVSKSLQLAITHDDILNKKPFLFYSQESLPFIDKLNRDKKKLLIVLGATWKSRIYPKEHLVEVIEALKENTLLLWGSSEEKTRAEWIAKQSQYATALPKLALNALKALIAKMDLVIGNDTGPTHMAWALNRPSLTLFGSTPVSRVYITPINQVLASDSIVDPCKLDKEDFSIQTISKESVIAKAMDLLYSIQPPPNTTSSS